LFTPGAVVPGELFASGEEPVFGDAAGDAAGEPVGLTAGAAAGLAVATGLGVVGLTSGVEVHAPKNTAEAAQTVSRTFLLNVIVFILFPCRSHASAVGRCHAVLSRQAGLPKDPSPQIVRHKAGERSRFTLASQITRYPPIRPVWITS